MVPPPTRGPDNCRDGQGSQPESRWLRDGGKAATAAAVGQQIDQTLDIGIRDGTVAI
jgi:hypothetical protein